MAKSLYICYFGLREPLVQTQVLPYLKEILKDGVEISLLTFEPELRSRWTGDEIEAERQQLASQGIKWHALPYHKRPSVPATFCDVLNGARMVRQLLSRENYDILHARVHLPALMAALARKLSRRKPKILFDIRGFFPEEYTDAGIWPDGGWLYLAAKRVERWLLKEADGFVVLTEKAREILFPESKETGFDKFGRPVEVIPCCVDFRTRFRLADTVSKTGVKSELDIGERFVVLHVGALGGLYLTEEIVNFMEAARSVRPDTFALFLTQTDPKYVTSMLKERGFSERDYFVAKVSSDEVPAYLEKANVGISFVKAAYSTQSRSPTKIPEYLAASLPLIANSGVGDVDELINEESVGVLIDDFERDTYIQAVKKVLKMGDVEKRCKEVARRRFDLETVGGERYRRVYRRILCR